MSGLTGWIREQDRRDEKRRLEERARQASYEKEEAESRARSMAAKAEREVADAQRAAAYAIEDEQSRKQEIVEMFNNLLSDVKAYLSLPADNAASAREQLRKTADSYDYL